MSSTKAAHATVLSPSFRLAVGALFLIAGVVLLLGASAMPFLFESSSIKYKFGLDKSLLRAGKVIGMAAGTLLLIQLPLSARIKLLDRVFSLNQLLVVHRMNGMLIAMLALLHPLFVFATSDITLIPVSVKYIPEILGACLLLLIGTVVAMGVWRPFLDLSFDRWWLTHRTLILVAVALLGGHVLLVSDTFASGPPRHAFLIALGIYALILARVKLKLLLMKRKPYKLTSITPLGTDAYSIELQKGSGIFGYLPGQFAFLRFQSPHLSHEEHPFSISSTPTRPASLQFSIRCSGDWTSTIGRLRPGDTALVDGPYGRFSHLAFSGRREIIMIAGGIGITPMVSMLRYMNDMKEERPVTLIWSNRTIDDVLYPQEFKDFQARLKGFRMIHIFTRHPAASGETGRLNRRKLAELLLGCSRNAQAFVCGPPQMMQEVCRGLVGIGFRRSSIYTEEFHL